MMTIFKKIFYFGIALLLVLGFSACKEETTTAKTTSAITTDPLTSNTTDTKSVTTAFPVFDGHVTYRADHIRTFGSGTPAGTVNYDSVNDTAIIWNTDASLDNYGGIQTPILKLDFAKAVIFQMEVEAVYSEYIVKLSVEGESESYYVISDEPRLGFISINVVDAMLSKKYQERVTMPDPGYRNGWKYDGEIKNCSFQILAKGPDGERQTAELIIKSISIYNDLDAIEKIAIESSEIVDGKIEKLKGSGPIQLSSSLTPGSGAGEEVFWSVLDEDVATITESGLLSFIGVGRTYVKVISAIDQSKEDLVEVNVLSGYEIENELVERLDELTYGGATTDAETFLDLFKTTWRTDPIQGIDLEGHAFLKVRSTSLDTIIENYFDEDNSDHIAIASSDLIAGKEAVHDLALDVETPVTVYWLQDGKLQKKEAATSIPLVYATYQSAYQKQLTYSIRIITVTGSNEARKIELTVQSSTLLKEYEPSDFLDQDQWIVPDRTKQALDPIVHQLSPGEASLVDGVLNLKQNKYPDAKYCFGGIASEVIHSQTTDLVEIVLDVASINQLNDYVKTMWEVKILYFYDVEAKLAVSSNPLKLASGNTPGLHSFTFTPAHQYYRLYLVANGSDIGAQFSGATIQVASLKVQVLD
ncbi:MAG: hypothetical protein ACOX16_01690 [Candidatus Izemoplasmatales bacterium]|jgi:hypothetical protein